MEVKETPDALNLEYDGKTVYFCNKRCMEKYIEENKISAFCESCAGIPLYKQRVILVSFITLIIIIISYIIPELNPLYNKIIEYLSLIWWAVLLGLLIGGVIDYFIPREYISKTLAKREKKTLFTAVIFGFLMSACSHGILAIAIQLYKKGASIPAVIAFLMAAPWANLAYTILLFSLFGMKAIYIIISAIIIALITGFAYQILDISGKIEKNPHTLKVKGDFSIRQDIRNRIREYKFSIDSISKAVKGVLDGSWALTTMIVWWILIGVLIASFIGTYIPHDIFMRYAGPSLLGLFITLIAATIIEVCSEGSSPIAFEIFKQTGAFGNSFVFLMAGVATDYTEIGILWSNIGKRTALYLPLIAGPQIILLGYLFNILL